MDNNPQLEALQRRLTTEHEAIIGGVGLVTRVWATAESVLCELFRVLSNFNERERELAGVIFYTPTNTETRIGFIHNLMIYHCEIKRLGDFDDTLNAYWKKLKGKIDSLKNARNAIVHSTIISSAHGSANQRMRLAPAHGDTLRFWAQISREQVHKGGQHIGLGPNDLKSHEEAVWRVIDRTRKLTEAALPRMRLAIGPHQGGEAQELLEAVSRLNSQTPNDQNNHDQGPPDNSAPE